MKLPGTRFIWRCCAPCAWVLAASWASAAATIVYVRSGNAVSPDGTSWTNAYPTVQQALSKASGAANANNQVEIWIATGTYRTTTGADRTQAFVIPSYVTLRGGFAGTETSVGQRGTSGNQTVLSGDIGTADLQGVTAATNFSDLSTVAVQDGSVASQRDNAYNVIRVTNATNVALDQLIITGGMADNSAVANASIGSMIQPQVQAAPGYVAALDSSVTGAGLFSQNANVTITNCIFARNTSVGAGGAILGSGAGISVTGTTFVRNYSGLVGGAVALLDEGPTFNGNTLYGNRAEMLGGALYVGSSGGSDDAMTGENNTLIQLGAIADAQAQVTTGVSPLDTQHYNTSQIRSDLTSIQKQARSLMQKASSAANSGESAAAADAASLTTDELTGLVKGLGSTYAILTLAVSTVDLGAQIALLLGANPNDPFFKTWETIDQDFTKYCTPVGLAEYIYSLIEGAVPVDHNLIQAQNRINDTHANHNPAQPQVYAGNAFTLNSTGGMGGAVAVMRTNLTLVQSYFQQNQGDVGGAAIAGFSYNDLVLEDCVISNNQSASGHSAVSVGSSCLLRVVNDTVINNHSAVSGGRAISTETGAITFIGNTLLWNNTAGSANTVGADLFAARYADLDANGKSAYSNAGDSHYAYIGICTVFYSDVQSLNTMTLGSANYESPAFFDSPDGFELEDQVPNIGEGIANTAVNWYAYNLSQAPSLIQTIVPSPYSPLKNAGDPDVSLTQESDILGNSRYRSNGSNLQIDIGAVQDTGLFPPGSQIYVDASAHGANNGLTWADAFTALPPALALPATPGVQIWVAKGTYSPTTRGNAGDTPSLQPGVSLIGGFTSGATLLAQSDPVSNPTILTGATYHSTLLLTGTDSGQQEADWDTPRVVQGFRFTASAGNGVTLIAPLVVNSCTFDQNAGRGLVVQSNNPFADSLATQLTNSVFKFNGGGGAEVDPPDLSVFGCDFYNNTAPSGAGLWLNPSDRGTTKIERSVFAFNTATAGPGGGMKFDGDTLTIAQSIFYANTALAAGSVTVRGEVALTQGGAGLYVTPVTNLTDFPPATLTNNIFYSNRLTGTFPTTSLERQNLGLPDLGNYAGPRPTLKGNDIEGLNQLATPGDANANVDYPPSFVNSAQDNFQVTSSSMLLNRGVAYTSGSDPTQLTGPADIGAYETSVTPAPLAVDGAPALVALLPTAAGRVFTLTAPAPATAGSSLQWQVERKDGLGWVNVVNDAYDSGAAALVLTITNPPYQWTGYQFRLTFTDGNGLPRYTSVVTLSAPPSFLFVTPTGAGTKDGTSWANALPNLAAAASLAQMYTQVFVEAGSYTAASVSLPPGVRVYGGFAGTETLASQRAAGHVTTLSLPTFTGSANQENLLTVQGTATWTPTNAPVPTIVDGFTLNCTQDLSNSVIAASSANVVISNDLFPFGVFAETAVHLEQTTGTVSGCAFSNGYEPAVTLANATATFAQCTFTGNGHVFVGLQSREAGSIYSEGGSAITVTDSTFTNCQGATAGAIEAQNFGSYTAMGGTLQVQRSRFLGCSGDDAGAIYVSQPGSHQIANSLFSNNQGRYHAGAITLDGSAAAAVSQCTLVGQSTAGGGAAVIDATHGTCVLTNSLVWNNRGSLFSNVVTHGDFVQGAGYDPLFDPASADFGLLYGSPLIDLGGNNATLSGTTDLEGKPRFYSGTPADLGAGEYQGTIAHKAYVRTLPTSQTVFVGQPVSFTIDASLDSVTAAPAAVTWQWNNGGSWQALTNLSDWTVTTTNGVSTAGNANPQLNADGSTRVLSLRAQFAGDSSLVVPVTLTVNPRIILYVNGAVSASGNGLTWAAAFKTIGEALNAATPYTDIWVATGTYNESNLTPPAGALLYLGFNGTETSVTQRDAVANPVLLGSTLASKTIIVGDTTTFFSPITLGSGQTAQWQVDRGDGQGFVNVIPDANTSLATANGVSTITLGGNLATSGYRYQVVILQGGAPVLTSVPATLTVVNRPQVYVDAQVAGGAQTGADWADAYSDLNAALAAYPAFADIFVAQGTYTVGSSSSLFLRRSLTLTGGYIAGTATRDPVAHRTILASTAGSTSFSVTMDAKTDRGAVDSLTVVDGFVFQNTGKAINLQGASPTIRNCRFEGVKIAVAAKASSSTLDTCTFIGGLDTPVQADVSGSLTITHGDFESSGTGWAPFTVTQASAIQLGQPSLNSNASGLSVAISDTKFNGGLSQAGVGGGQVILVTNGSTVTISRSTFTGNVGGLTVYPGAHAVVRDSLFAGNTGQPAIEGGGPTTVAFCTVADNTSYSAAVDLAPSGVLEDSIVWNNHITGSGQPQYQVGTDYNQPQPTLSHNLIQSAPFYVTGTATLPFDPRFVNEAGGNYQLAPDSPAIGAAGAADLQGGETDVVGTARPQSGGPDLGAYEPTAPTSPVFSLGLPAALTGAVGANFTLAYTAPAGDSIAWQYSADGTTWTTITTQVTPPGLTQVVVSALGLGLSGVTSAANGLQFRAVLTAGSKSYTSPTVPLTVQGFQTLYVDASVAASGNGQSWAAAYKTLSEALAGADAVHRIIDLAQGAYQPNAGAPDSGTFHLSGFQVFGGFPAGGSGSRDPVAHPAMLTASGGTAVTMADMAPVPTVLDGVTVQNSATGLSVSGAFSSAGLISLNRVTVKGNSNTGLVVGGTVSVTDSVFENNTGTNGGGIHILSGAPNFERDVISGNTASGNGGGVENDAGFFSATFHSVLISGNVAAQGGGFYANGTSQVLNQVTIAGNRAQQGGAMVTLGSAQTFLNDCIVWGNQATGGGADPELYAAFRTSFNYPMQQTIVGQTSLTSGVLRTDPVFASPVDAGQAPTTAGDYRLRGASPAIDAGLNSVVTGHSEDLDDAARIVGATVDLGAYEYTGTAGAPLVVTGQPSNLTFRRDGTGDTLSVTAAGAASVTWQYAPVNGTFISLVGVSGFSGANTGTLTISAAAPSLSGVQFRAVLTAADGSAIATSAATLTVYNPQYYVNAGRSGTDAGDGLSWATAFRSLNSVTALPFDPDGTTVWVAAGSYPMSTQTPFLLRPGVMLYGGFAGTETALSQRSLAANGCIITGVPGLANPAITVTAAAGSLPAVIDGFTLGIVNNGGETAVQNAQGVTLTLNQDTFTGWLLAVSAKSPTTITACTFTSNYEAIIASGSTLAVSRASFLSNGSIGGPSVVAVGAGTGTTFDTCLFAANGSPALAVNGGTLKNLTIASNMGSGLQASGTVNLYNSILWGNRNPYNWLSFSAQIAGGLASSSGNAIEGVNLAASPFISAAPVTPALTLGDYHLATTSGLIDSGDNSHASTTGLDLAGNPRLAGVLVDAGAYEYSGDPYALTAPASAMGTVGAPARFTVTTVAPVAVYTWQESLDGTNWSSLTNGGAYAGTSTAALAVTGDGSFAGRQYRVQLQFVSGTVLDSSAVPFLYTAVTEQAAGASTPAVFTAAATGSPTGYAWQQSIAGGAYTNLSDGTAVQGSATAALTVAGDGSFSNRKYRALVSYAASASNPTNALGYVQAVFGAVPAGVASQGTLAYGSTGFGFTITGGIRASTLTDSTFAVYSAMTGRVPLADLTTPVVSGNAVNLGFKSVLPAGDRVSVTATSGLHRADGVGATAQVWQFRNGTNSGTGRFEAVTKVTGAGSGNTAIAAGDLDGNGTVDAIVAGPNGNQVYLNDGHGTLTAQGAAFGPANAKQIVLGDLTGAGAVDAAIVNSDGSIGIWTNDGTGAFTLHQTLAETTARAVAIGDLDGDAAQDLFVARSPGNGVYFNDGAGNFATRANAPAFGSTAGTSVALGDVNGDGTLDALVGANGASQIFINPGNGAFAAGALLPAADQVDLADFNGDGRPEAVLTRANASAQVWQSLANGLPVPFAGSLGGGAATLATGDVTGAGKIDLVLADATGALGTWVSQGSSGFVRAANQDALSFGAQVALADLDGDGALDLIGLDPTGQLAVSRYHVTATVTPENTPAAIAASGLIQGGGASTADVKIASLPTLGTLTTSGGGPVNVGDTFSLSAAATLVYTPAPFENGEDAFTWNASTDGTTFGAAAIPYYLYVVSVVNNVVANPDSFTVLMGGTAATLDGGAASVLANDVNHDAGGFVAMLVQRPAHGALTFNSDGTFRYVHDNSETLSDQFTYRAENTTTGRSADAVVTITVTHVNQPPTGIGFAAGGNVYTGQAAGAVVGTFTGTDPDPGDAAQLAFTLVGGAGSDNNAEFTISGSALETAGPLPLSEGTTRTIRVRATDTGGLFAEQSFTIGLIAQPLATAASYPVNEDSTLAITLAGTGGVGGLTYAVVAQPAHGTLTGSGANVTYQGAPFYRGGDSFTFTVSDGVVTSDPASVSITILPTNHAPTLAAATLADTDDKTPVSVTLQGTDPDGDTVQYAVQAQGRYGQASISGSTLTYTPFENVLSTASDDYISVYAFDGQSGVSNVITIQVQVTPINDPPVLTGVAAQGYSTLRGALLTIPVSLRDPDSAPTLGVGTAPQNGTVSFDTSGNVLYHPNAGFVGTDTFTIVGTDGTLTTSAQTITVVVTDPQPVASDASATGNENTQITTFMNGTDAIGDTLTPAIVSGPANGTIRFYALSASSWIAYYSPNFDFFGTDSVTYTFSDSTGNASAPATLTFNVTQVVTPPVANAVTYSGSGLTLSVPLTLAGTDPQGLPLTYRIVTQPAQGTLSGPGPSLTYTLTAPYAGADSFTYVVNNGIQDSAPATVSLTFVNDHPGATVVGDLETAYRGLRSTWNVLANDSDPWGNPLFIVAVTQGAHGTVTTDEQTVTYQHNGDSATFDQFNYTVSNFSGTTVEGTVFVTIADRSFTVLTAGDTGDGTLRAAFDAINAAKFQKLAPDFTATPDWTIAIGPSGNLGTGLNPDYDLLTAGEVDPTLGSSALTIVDGIVAINGAGGPITVDLAEGAGPMRLLHVGAHAHVTISGVNFTGGTAHLGGAIYNEGLLTLQNATIGGATAQSLDGNPGLGGGVFESGRGTSGLTGLTLTNVTFSGNTAGLGGGLYNVGGPVTISGGAFSSNLATTGGAIYNTVNAFGGAITDTGGTAFTGNGSGGDVADVGSYPVLATFAADATVAMQNPISPWVGPVPDTTIRSHFSYQVPVTIQTGQSVAFTSATIPHSYATLALTGNDAVRTITADFTNQATAGTYAGQVVADNGVGGQFIRSVNLTVDPAASRPVVAHDAYIDVAPGGTVPIQALALANVVDPEGGSTANDGFNPTSNPSQGTLFQSQGIWYYNAHSVDPGSDTITYTTIGGVTGTIHIHITSLTQHPSSEADSGAGSLRSDVELAQTYSQQAWTFQPSGLTDGVITVSSADETDPTFGRSAFAISGNVTIDGSQQAQGLTIGVDPAAPAMRLFHVLPGATLTLSNVTVQGGQALLGGAIYNEGTVVLNQAVLQDNTATGLVNGVSAAGGAIYNDGGTLTVAASTLQANTATMAGQAGIARGGAVFVHNGSVSISGSSLTGNTADDAGALFVHGDGATATVHLLSSILGGSAATSDLNELASGTGGHVTVYRTDSTISLLGGVWVSDIPSCSIGASGQVAFLASDSMPGLTLVATSENQSVIPNAGLTIGALGDQHKLTLDGTVSGVTNVHLIASSQNVDFQDLFTVTSSTAITQPPVAVADSASIFPLQSATIHALANDSDPNGLSLSITAVSAPAHGTATLNGDGTITYTETDASFQGGVDSFTYTLTNSAGGTAAGAVNVTVQSTTLTVANLSDFLAAIHSVETNAGADDFNSANDAPAPNPGVPWTIVINPSAAHQTWQAGTQFNDGSYYTQILIHGNVTIDGSQAPGFALKGSPGDFSGPPKRIFTVYPSARLTLKSMTLMGASPFAFGPNGQGGAVRNLGTFTASNVTFQGNTVGQGAALGGGLYNDGGVATLTQCAFNGNSASGFGGGIASHNGTLTLSSVTFSGNSAPTGRDLYLFGDGAKATLHLVATSVAGYATATANGGTLTVTGYVAAGTTTISRFGTGAVQIAVNSLLNISTGAGITFVNADAASVAGVPITVSGGVLTYGATSIDADDTFKYRIEDSNGNVAVGTVTMHWVDRPPIAKNVSFSRTAGQALTIPIASLLANDSDPDGDAISLASVDCGSAQGATVTKTATTVVYDPGATDTVAGDDTFDYTIEDIYGQTATATVTIHTTAAAITPVVSAAVQGGVTVVTVSGMPNTTYTVTVSSDLLNWSTLGTVRTDALGTGTIDDAALPAEAAGRYYRTNY